MTAPEERIAGKIVDAHHVTFDIGSFTDPTAKQKHTEMSITSRRGSAVRVALHIKWCDKVKIWDRGAEFATTPAEAPVIWPGADGPLSFCPYPLQLNVGEAKEVTVRLGHPGHGRDFIFCAVPYTFLPRDVPILATLHYTDKEGKERRAQAELRGRCCSNKFHGPVLVPADAAPGKAILRVELPKDYGHVAIPTDLPVELVTKPTLRLSDLRNVDRKNTTNGKANNGRGKADVQPSVKVVKYDALQDSIKEFRGKVVVVDYWADYCIICKKEFPHLVEMQRKYADDLAAVSVSLDDPSQEEAIDKVQRFVQAKNAMFTNLILNEKPELWQKKLGFDGPPAVFVYDRTGKLKKVFKEDFTYEDIERLVKELLGK